MKYYCIGIKGSGMSTLAQILFDLGNEVSGYDDAKGHKFTQVGLDERGIINSIVSKNNHDDAMKKIKKLVDIFFRLCYSILLYKKVLKDIWRNFQ